MYIVISHSHYARSLPTLNFYGIDIPLKYYSYVGRVVKQQMYAFGGITPSWLMRPEGGSLDWGIPEEYFRNIYLSIVVECVMIKRNQE